MAVLDDTKVCRDCGMAKSLAAYTKKERGILGVRAECNQCRGINRRTRYAGDEAHRLALLAEQKRRYEADPLPLRQRVKAWRADNPERAREGRRRSKLANLKQFYQRQKEWARRNKHLVNAATARRAASKRNATVAWANKFYIEQAYEIARVRTEMTGVVWHVDHIVPLRSPLVCGLHVESNFQVIPAKVNNLKSNVWWPDMWEPVR